MLKINGYITFCTYNSMISEVSKYKHHHNNIIQVKKTFRKNGRNVGMASTSIGRKEVSFIYVDHTINSARGHDEEDVGWWPRAEFMV